MPEYYSEKLSGQRLRRCYELAPARVKQYFRTEMEFILSRITHNDVVLDLGCGYGRCFDELNRKTGRIIGVDISLENLR